MIDKIKGLRKYTDCSMPSNEQQRIEKAECAAYNQAIEDVVKLFAIPDVSHNEVCPECGYPKFKKSFEDFERCEGCEWTSKRSELQVQHRDYEWDKKINDSLWRLECARGNK